MKMRGRITPRESAVLFQGLSFLVLGIVMSYFAYLWGPATLNFGAFVGSVLFWCAVILLLFAFPLRRTIKIFSGHIHSIPMAATFAAYLAIHLFLYGFMLDAILTSFYGAPSSSVPMSIFLTTNVFTPPSLTNALLGLAYNPSITVIITPVLNSVLSFYGISVALVIGVLLVANIGKTHELGRLCTAWNKARSLILLPALGVILGASCCLSVPFLIAIAIPSMAVPASALWLSYFLFPPFAVAVLYMNLYSIEKISAKVQPSPPG